MSRAPKRSLGQVENVELRALKERFDAAHAEGLAALKRKDHDGARKAIRLQATILEEQRNLVLFRLNRAKRPSRG